MNKTHFKLIILFALLINAILIWINVHNAYGLDLMPVIQPINVLIILFLIISNRNNLSVKNGNEKISTELSWKRVITLLLIVLTIIIVIGYFYISWGTSA